MAPPPFAQVLAAHGLPPLRRDSATTLQVNVGKLCNQACHHCHVEAGPKRPERMGEAVASRVLELLAASPSVETLDVTGGAPELNPCFRRLVAEARRLGRRVIDRCNLTVLFEPGQDDLPEFLAAHGVDVVASLPCYTAANVEAQRGHGVFDKSIRALQRLNALGYGGGRGLRLDLVYNPVGAFLPPAQAELEARYREELQQSFGIVFDRLLTITNMPIKRFAEALARQGAAAAYQSLLVNHFNPETVGGLMCRSLVSVGWDGRLYDCDFNQMLELPLADGRAGTPRTVWDFGTLDETAGLPVATADHCFGCTAGAGSSCGGALA
ncbi:MAG TPA: arsenosugar biosynthesis radical SAM (seleno)protein ArsS [Candidatus Limnocylindria bacterium]|nr:arsenosugar biosynthesis radical SAM (seleno)protein ArsS [Candidatus Limnocylindria bacterium]